MLTDKQLYLFDIDGTLCLGDTWIDGGRELLALLRAQGKQSLFLPTIPPKVRRIMWKSFGKWA